jgi:hypothetical protein
VSGGPVVIGIDPGKAGAFAVLPLHGGAPFLGVLPYAGKDAQPQCRALRAAVSLAVGVAPIVLVGVEDVNSFGMGRQSAFVFGQGIGALLCLVELEGWPLVRVLPRAWQKTIGATRKGGPVDPLGPVSRLFPTTCLVPKGCRKPHMGYVDALGIAEHVRRMAVGGSGGEALPFG